MKTTLRNLIARFNTTKLGIATVIIASGATAMTIAVPKVLEQHFPDLNLPTTYEQGPDLETKVRNQGGVELTIIKSQDKLVQGSGEELYLDVRVDVPEVEAALRGEAMPTEMILVLDQSSSMVEKMQAKRKIDFAKAAINAFSEHLRDSDRIGLVAFSSQASVEFPLTKVSSVAQRNLARVVLQLEPQGSTNLEAGMRTGFGMFTKSQGNTSRRLVVLSDGHANTGISDIPGLSRIVQQHSRLGVVVSTVGMGIDFNEDLLAKIADHGMGNYTYLETLENLAATLKRDLENARAQFATNTFLRLKLGAGVQIADTAGYPTYQDQGEVVIPLGQLLAGSSKTVTLAMVVPQSQVGVADLGNAKLSYERDGTVYQTPDSSKLTYAVVPPSRKGEALASINAAVFEKSWLANNLGRVENRVSSFIKSGDRNKAIAEINAYKSKLADLRSQTGMPLQDKKSEKEISQLEDMTQDAFTGNQFEQSKKQKSYSKTALSKSRKRQRVINKK